MTTLHSITYKTNFYNNYYSIEMPFDGNDHHTNNKANYFGILHLNKASLNKHIKSLSNALSIIKFDFPIIGLSANSGQILSSIISLYQVILFVMMKLRASMVLQISI